MKRLIKASLLLDNIANTELAEIERITGYSWSYDYDENDDYVEYFCIDNIDYDISIINAISSYSNYSDTADDSTYQVFTGDMELRDRFDNLTDAAEFAKKLIEGNSLFLQLKELF